MIILYYNFKQFYLEEASEGIGIPQNTFKKNLGSKPAN